MGLDGVELVMAVEEAFGVEFKNDELEKTLTPRMVGDMVFSKLQVTNEKTCQTQRAFYILRRAFRKMFGLPRKSITPDMNFRGLIPRSKEKEVWPRIKTAIAARRWPDLARPAWLSRTITVVSLALFGVTVYGSVRIFLGVTLGILSGVVVAGMFGAIATRLTRPFRVCIPPRFQRIRDLVPYAVTSDHVKWTREQVSALVKKVVMEQLALGESQYTEDARFVEDLGVG